MSYYNKAYSEYYTNGHKYFGHYFRYLYRVFKFIDEETGDRSVLYSKIIRSQLTNYELVLLYYNGLSDYGEKFKLLLEKYEVFDNLPLDLLINENHVNLYKRSVWGGDIDIVENKYYRFPV